MKRELASAARALHLRLAPRSFLRSAKPNDQELGRLGERLAARHLGRQGWRVQARRLETRWGELDLVLCRGDTLACVEVKSGRRGALFRPLDRVTHKDRARLAAAARGLARQLGAAHGCVLLVEVDTTSTQEPLIEIQPG